MSFSKKKLPISVVIPTLNCREKLERHLEDSKEWFPKVGQIIAVDSNSTDGTLELLRDVLTPYGAEIITTGLGLYRAWNLGVAKATQPYIYFSTIGEILEENALEEMCHFIELEACDVLISPPRMVNEFNQPIEKKWPIHRIQEVFSENCVTVPSADQLLILSTFSIPESIIGSSASNLYKSNILKKLPFPENFGMIGDVIWALENLPLLRVCICGNHFATFCFDGDRSTSWEKSHEIMNLINAHVIQLLEKNIWPKNIMTLAIQHNIFEKKEKLSVAMDYDKWIKSIFSSSFNRFKINTIDSFSLRTYLEKFFS